MTGTTGGPDIVMTVSVDPHTPNAFNNHSKFKFRKISSLAGIESTMAGTPVSNTVSSMIGVLKDSTVSAVSTIPRYRQFLAFGGSSCRSAKYAIMPPIHCMKIGSRNHQRLRYTWAYINDIMQVLSIMSDSCVLVNCLCSYNQSGQTRMCLAYDVIRDS